jgi:hypothetical protein
MPLQLGVGWAPLLPFDPGLWRDSLDLAIGNLQSQNGPVVAPVERPEEADVVFAPYMATDHQRVVDEHKLTSLVARIGAKPHALFLVAFGRTRRGHSVSDDNVRELLIEQGPTIETEYHRLLTPELFRDQAYSDLFRKVDRRRLMARAEIGPDITEQDIASDDSMGFLAAESQL